MNNGLRGNAQKIPTNQRGSIEEPLTESTGTLIAFTLGQTRSTFQLSQTIRRCMMNRNIALLSIGATLSLSLFIVDLSHAVHIDRARQYAQTRMAADVTEPANP